jgi:hypothetical protein
VRLGAHRITATVLVAIVDCEVTRARCKCLRRLVYSPAALRKCHRSDGGQPHARCDECGGACVAATIARQEERAPTTTRHVCVSTVQMNECTRTPTNSLHHPTSITELVRPKQGKRTLPRVHARGQQRSQPGVRARTHTESAQHSLFVATCGSLVTDKICKILNSIFFHQHRKSGPLPHTPGAVARAIENH